MRRMIARIIIAVITLTIGVFATYAVIRCQLSLKPIHVERSNDSQIQTEQNKIIQDRDLSLYDFGGNQSYCYQDFQIPPSKDSSCESKLRDVRAFIWKHWQDKKRAYIIINFVSTDASSNAHIFIEPDENNEWCIVWRWERIFGLGVKKGNIDELPHFRVLNLKRAAKENKKYEVCTEYLEFFGYSIQTL